MLNDWSELVNSSIVYIATPSSLYFSAKVSDQGIPTYFNGFQFFLSLFCSNLHYIIWNVTYSVLCREAAASIILNDDTASGHSADSQQDLAEFDAAYPTIENDLTETSGRYADAEMANKWFKKVSSIIILKSRKLCDSFNNKNDKVYDMVDNMY